MGKMTKEQMIAEEQQELDNLIHDLDKEILAMDTGLTQSDINRRKAKAKCLPEAYGDLMHANDMYREYSESKTSLLHGRNELYDTRIIVYITSDKPDEGEEELKIGLHSFHGRGGRIFIISWKMPFCRHFIFNPSATSYDGVVEGKYGAKYHVHYELKFKRRVEMDFDEVTDVEHFLPEDSEYETAIVYDEFLKELESRRNDATFRNIIFSIQQKQSEIIQAPFAQHMIVQGCAGSGKSMIMLHRLPIVLYDNSYLSRKGIYIITPSQTYIQMADDMRSELEIDDLQMSTINGYYNHLIEKYEYSAEDYGTIDSGFIPSYEEVRYIYSDRLINDVRRIMEGEVKSCRVDLKRAMDQFHLMPSVVSEDTIIGDVRKQIQDLQKVILEQDAYLRRGYDRLRPAINVINSFRARLKNRRADVENGIRKRINDCDEKINSAAKEIKMLDPEKNKIAYNRRKQEIETAQNNREALQELLKKVEADKTYFDGLNGFSERIGVLSAVFPQVTKQFDEMSEKERQNVLKNWRIVGAVWDTVASEAADREDRYAEIIGPLFDHFVDKIQIRDNLNEIGKEGSISEAEKEEIQGALNNLTKLQKDLPKITYVKWTEERGFLQENKKTFAASFTPYVFTQILYQYKKIPKAEKESLVTIDEAQNLEPKELELIRDVNGGKVIFNLYGDVKQHIEETKGVDDWGCFSEYAAFTNYELNENYRNAYQITEFCNERFSMKMVPINLPGRGVHLVDQREFESMFENALRNGKTGGTCCIIVKNKSEAEAIENKWSGSINNMVLNPQGLTLGKWNLITVEQAKGLEFKSVFAISGRMSENERYIAYTRALDELYVYDTELELKTEGPVEETKQEESVVGKTEGIAPAQKEPSQEENSLLNKALSYITGKRKRDKKSAATSGSLDLAGFFKQKGANVIDMRNNGGYLWVLGSNTSIEPIINEAVEKYGVFGSYGYWLGKEGWYTKSKK